MDLDKFSFLIKSSFLKVIEFLFVKYYLVSVKVVVSQEINNSLAFLYQIPSVCHAFEAFPIPTLLTFPEKN